MSITMLLSTSRHQRSTHYGAIRDNSCQCFDLGMSSSTTRTARKIGFMGSRAALLPWLSGVFRPSSSCTAQPPSSIDLPHELADRLCILPDFCPFQQQLDSPMICSQSFRIEDSMHKLMAASTKPSNAVQTPSLFTRAPPSFKSLSMDAAGNKMMSR